MLKSIKTRTVTHYLFWLIAMGVIIHVVERDFLGLNPDYNLTSAVITFFIGGILLAIPSIIRSDFQPLIRRADGPSEKEDLHDIGSLVISFILMLAIALALHYSHLIPQYRLESALYTLFMGSIVMAILSFVRYLKGKSQTRDRAGRGSATEQLADS